MKLKALLPLALSFFLSLPCGAEELGRLACDLYARQHYSGQSAYMDFYHHLALSQDGVQVSLCGPLSIKGVVSGGRITEDNLKYAYPFPNKLTVIRMSGEQIRKYLEASYDGWIRTVSGPGDTLLRLSARTAPDGSVSWNFSKSPAHFDSAGGIFYTVDISRSAGSRVSISALADGTPFEAEAIYTVGMTDYRAHGTGGLLAAAGIDAGTLVPVSEGVLLRDILRDCLQKEGVMDPAAYKQGGWSFVPESLAGVLMQRDLSLVFGTAPHNTRPEIEAQPRKAYGEYLMYEETKHSPTPAPKGYKAFYVSHFGRHGARYCLNSSYSLIDSVLDSAACLGVLTPKGEELLAAWKSIAPRLMHREGVLTQSGQRQHRYIARRLYEDYPQVFKGATVAEAVSTGVPRVIASMYCFLGELEKLDKSLSYSCDYGAVYLKDIDPDDSANPWREHIGGLSAVATKRLESFRRSRIDSEELLGTWFTDAAFIESMCGENKFLQTLYLLCADCGNLDFEVPEEISGMFTPEQLYRFWQVRNLSGYHFYAMAPGTNNRRCEIMRASVQDIIDKAEEDMDRGVALRLRFTHDSCLLPLLSYMDVNGMGARIKDPWEVEDWWRSFDVPMASNMQFIFFRSSRKDSPVLFKLLLNGREASLPLEAAGGPYYRWQDFVEYFTNHN